MPTLSIINLGHILPDDDLELVAHHLSVQNPGDLFDLLGLDQAHILPIMLGVGLLKAVLIILSMLHILDNTGSTYAVLSFVADAGFYFMPVNGGQKGNAHKADGLVEPNHSFGQVNANIAAQRAKDSLPT